MHRVVRRAARRVRGREASTGGEHAAASAAIVPGMPRPSSIPALFRKLVVLRWKKLSLNARLAVVAGSVLAVAALVSSAWGACPARSCCTRNAAEVTHPALEADVAHPAIAEGADEGCPFARAAD